MAPEPKRDAIPIGILMRNAERFPYGTFHHASLNARLTIADSAAPSALCAMQHMAELRDMLAIQFIAAAALRAADGADASWDTHYALSGVDYASYPSVARAVALLEGEAGGATAYRVVELASVADSYLDRRAENEDALEAMAAWVEAGCPRQGKELMKLERAALACAKAAPVKVVRQEAA